MGEAKRKKKDRFSPAQFAALERVLEVAYRRARAGLQAARAAEGERRAAALADLHRDTVLLVDALTEEYFATDPEGATTRARIACAKGCSFCCHTNVEVTILEAIAVAHHVGRRADLAASALATAPKVARMPPWIRYDLRIPCAFLREGACSIYDVRPRACRAHVSYSAASCEEVLTSGDSKSLPPMVTFGWPRTVSKAIGHGTLHAMEHERLQAVTVELNAAVALLLERPDAVDGWMRGETVFEAYGDAGADVGAGEPPIAGLRKAGALE